MPFGGSSGCAVGETDASWNLVGSFEASFGILSPLGGFLGPFFGRFSKLQGLRLRGHRDLHGLFAHGRRCNTLRRSRRETIDEGKRRASRHAFRRGDDRLFRTGNRADGDVGEAACDRCIKTDVAEFRIRTGGENIGVDGPAAADHETDHRRRDEQTLRGHFAGWSFKCGRRELVTRNRTRTHSPCIRTNFPSFPLNHRSKRCTARAPPNAGQHAIVRRIMLAAFRRGAERH